MKNFKNIAIILPLFTLSSCQPTKQIHEDHDYQAATNAIYYGSIDVTNSFDSVVKLFGKTSECSGTLISPRLVLTNAHCTKANLYVTNLNDFDVDDPKARVSKIRKMIKHPDFFDYGGPESPIEYDLALAILDKEIKIEKYPSVIRSEYEFTRNLSLHHNRVTQVGYGLDENDYHVRERRYRSARVYNKFSKCERNYNISDINLTIEHVGNSGDSGGPVFFRKRNNELKLASVHAAYVDLAYIEQGLRYSCPRSKSVKLYPHKNWFKNIGFDIFNDSVEELEKSVSSFLKNNPQDINRKYLNMNTGEVLGLKIKDFRVFSFKDASKDINMSIRACVEDYCHHIGTTKFEGIPKHQSIGYEQYFSIGPKSFYLDAFNKGYKDLKISLLSNTGRTYGEISEKFETFFQRSYSISDRIFNDEIMFEYQLNFFNQKN